MQAARVLIAVLILCVSLFAVSKHSSAGGGHHTGHLAGRHAAVDLSELAWLAGNWTGTQDKLEMEEYWQAPKGNTMLGLHRDVAGGRTVSFEFLRIEATSDGITYWASPRGRSATPFTLIELKGKRVVFENAKHDFPQRIIYWLSDDGALHAKIEGMLKGKPASEEWTWHRSPTN